MSTISKALRIQIQEECRRTGKTYAAVLLEILERRYGSAK